MHQIADGPEAGHRAPFSSVIRWFTCKPGMRETRGCVPLSSAGDLPTSRGCDPSRLAVPALSRPPPKTGTVTTPMARMQRKRFSEPAEVPNFPGGEGRRCRTR